MIAEERRRQIIHKITNSGGPISASVLAGEFDVSRQVIVGDIALLRASGHEIIATARGYINHKNYNSEPSNIKFLGKIACRHSPDDTVNELYTITDLQASVIDVIVEHELYGEITGSLNLSSRVDVDAFIEKLRKNEVRLLSELMTDGAHLHTIACKDKGHFEQVRNALDEKGFLYRG